MSYASHRLGVHPTLRATDPLVLALCSRGSTLLLALIHNDRVSCVSIALHNTLNLTYPVFIALKCSMELSVRLVTVDGQTDSFRFCVKVLRKSLSGL